MLNPEFWMLFTALTIAGWISVIFGWIAIYGTIKAVAGSETDRDAAYRSSTTAIIQMMLVLPFLVGIGLYVARSSSIPIFAVVLKLARLPADPQPLLERFGLALLIGLGIGIARMLIVPFETTSRRNNLCLAFYGSIYGVLVQYVFGITIIIWLLHFFLGISLKTSLTPLGWAAIGIIAIVVTVNFNSPVNMLPSVGFSIIQTTSNSFKKSVIVFITTLIIGWTYWTLGIEAAIIASLVAGIIHALRPPTLGSLRVMDVNRFFVIVEEITSADTLEEIHAIFQRERALLQSPIITTILEIGKAQARKSRDNERLIAFEKITIELGRYYYQRIMEPAFAPDVTPQLFTNLRVT